MRLLLCLILIGLTSCQEFRIKKISHISEHFAYFTDVAVTDDDIYLCYKDYAYKNRLTVRNIHQEKIRYTGQPGFSPLDSYYGNIIISNGIVWTAFMDCGLDNRLTVMRYENDRWEFAVRGLSAGYCDNIALAAGPDGRIIIAYSDRAFNSRIFVKEFHPEEWVLLAELDASLEAVSSSLCLVINREGNPVVLYPDSTLNLSPVIAEINPGGIKKTVLSGSKSMNPALSFNRTENFLDVLVTEVDSSRTVWFRVKNGAVTSQVVSRASAGNHALVSTDDGTLYLALGEGRDNRLVLGTVQHDVFRRIPARYYQTPSASYISGTHSRNTAFFSFKDNEENEQASLLMITPDSH
jgi:hypothetical protein